MKRIALVLVLFATPAFAEPQTIEQRIGAQIGACVIQSAALAAQVEQLQVRIKALEDKYEPKTPASK